MLIASATLAVLLAFDTQGEEPGDAPPAAQSPTAQATATALGVSVRAAVTSNLRARPSRQAAVVAILPLDHIARVVGRTEEADWLRVAYPPTSSLEGWVPVENVLPLHGDPASVAVLASSAPPPGGTPEPDTPVEPERLPDLRITDAFLLPSGSLTVRIENGGSGLFDGTVGLLVTSTAGEILGVLDIERTQLAPGRNATVDTRVQVTVTGSYVIELDRRNEVEESNEFNNTYRATLVPAGG